jgi:hypothetical protein
MPRRGRGGGRGGGAGSRGALGAFGGDDTDGGEGEPVAMENPELRRLMDPANKVKFYMCEESGRYKVETPFLPDIFGTPYGYVRENEEGYMNMPQEFIDCMGSTSKGFRTKESSFMNTDKTFRDCGPGLNFVQEMASPVPPKCLKVCAYFTNLINCCDRLNGCVVPTIYTKLTIEHKKVIGVQHVSEEESDVMSSVYHMDINKLMQHQVAIENGNSMVVEKRMDPVSCVARMVPVKYKDSKGKDYFRLFMVVSMTGKSGVDVLSCIDRITNPNDYTTAADKERALARQTLWKSVWLQELRTCQQVAERDDAVNNSVTVDHNNDHDPINPYMFLNMPMVFKKIEAIVDLEQSRLVALDPELKFTVVEMYGVATPISQDDHSMYQKTCQAYCDRVREHRADFRVAVEHFYSGLKSGVAPDVHYNLRHVPGLMLNHECPETDSMLDLFFGQMETPLTLEWSPLNALNFNEEWEKFDLGMLPLTTRILVLDFQAGTVEMNESVLADRDRLKAVDENRWNLYYSKMRDPLLEYVRPGCYAMWLKGIRNKLTSMLSDARAEGQTKVEMYVTSRKIVDRLRMYFTQASRWHLAQIDIGEYRSDCLQGGHAVLREFRDELPGRMKDIYSKFVNSRKDSSNFTLLTQMRLTFYNCTLSVNQFANMTYANMDLFVQIFTSDMLWHFGHNETWTTFCQCIQVVPMKGTFVHTVQRGKNSYEVARFVAKPNSSGTDAIVAWWYNCMMMLPEKVRAGLINLCLTMVGIHRTTPVALERQSKVRIVADRIMSEPAQSSRFRLQKMTEERYLDKASLAAKVRTLPRHKNANEDAGVNTTDMDENGRRVEERWVDVGGYFLTMCATNAKATNPEEAESWNTLLEAMLWKSTGKYVTEKRSYTDFEDHEVIASTKTTTAIDNSEFQEEMCVPMCVIPKITGQVIALMNQFGLTSVEIDSISRDLDSWFCFMFDLFFNCFANGKTLSFRRRLDGMQARTVAESAMSRLMFELYQSETFDLALEATCMNLSYHAIDPVDVAVYADDGVRQVMDHPFLVMHHIIANEILQFPVVNFDWICTIIKNGIATPQDKACADGQKIMAFLRDCLDNDRFLLVESSDGGGQQQQYDFQNPNNGAGAPRNADAPRTSTKVPYVSSVVLDAQNVAGDDEFVRVSSKSQSSPLTLISQALRKNKHIAKLHRVAGLPMDEDMMYQTLNTYTTKMLDISAYLCTNSSLSPARLFSCFGFHQRIPEGFHDGIKRVDSVNMGMVCTKQHPNMQDLRQISYGVHFVAGILVSALLGPKMMANSTCDSVASGAIMQQMLLQAPEGLLAPTGKSFLRKSFSGSVVSYDTLKVPTIPVSGHRTLEAAYFTRPKHDGAILKDQTVQYMPCNRYKNYCPEDLLHMSNLVAAHVYFKFDHIGMLPVDLVKPNYNLLYNVYYPIARSRETMYDVDIDDTMLDSVSMHGYIKTFYCETERKGMFQIYVAYVDSNGKSAIDRDPVVDCFADGNKYDLMTLASEALGPMQLVVSPLVNRNHAVVYNKENNMFGVIVPLSERIAGGAGSSARKLLISDNNNISYFSAEHISYSVLWEGDQDPEWVHSMSIEDVLLPLATKIYMRFTVYEANQPLDTVLPVVAAAERESTYVVVFLRYEQMVPKEYKDFHKMVLCVPRKCAETETHLYALSVSIGDKNHPRDFILAPKTSELPEGVSRLIKFI